MMRAVVRGVMRTSYSGGQGGSWLTWSGTRAIRRSPGESLHTGRRGVITHDDSSVPLLKHQSHSP